MRVNTTNIDSEIGCGQVVLCWRDEDDDWISFDTEKELVVAVESVAARGNTRTIQLKAEILNIPNDTTNPIEVSLENSEADSLEMATMTESSTSPTSTWVLVTEETYS